MAGTMGLLLIQNRRRYTKPKVKNDIRHFWYIIKSTYVTKKHRQKLFVNTFVCVCVCRHVCRHSFACVSSCVLPFLRMCVVIPSHVSVMCVSSRDAVIPAAEMPLCAPLPASSWPWLPAPIRR